MTRNSPVLRGDLSQQTGGRVNRLLHLGTLIALAGVALAATLAYVHAQLDGLEAGYTSFCNINSAVNCDQVLTSSFAKLAGIPVAWLALAAYLAIAALLEVAARAEPAAARRALQLAAAAVIGSAVYSAFMALVSLTVLGTICLMCTGLYVVALALLFVTVAAARAFGTAHPKAGPPLSMASTAALTVVSIVAVAGLARATWPSRLELSALESQTLAELRAADAEFYDWYTSLPVLDAAGSERHVTGNAEAPVTIVEFSDFLCGYCARNHQMLKELVARHPTLVRVVYRHFPLDAACNEAVDTSLHPRACRAAEAAECAGQQNRFADMADRLFEEQRRLYEANLIEIAEGLGLDMAAFRACLDDHRTRPDVLADSREGERLRVSSTPTLFINGRRVEGSLPAIERYEMAITIEARLRSESRSGA